MNFNYPHFRNSPPSKSSSNFCQKEKLGVFSVGKLGKRWTTNERKQMEKGRLIFQPPRLFKFCNQTEDLNAFYGWAVSKNERGKEMQTHKRSTIKLSSFKRVSKETKFFSNFSREVSAMTKEESHRRTNKR